MIVGVHRHHDLASYQRQSLYILSAIHINAHHPARSEAVSDSGLEEQKVSVKSTATPSTGAHIHLLQARYIASRPKMIAQSHRYMYTEVFFATSSLYL